MAVTSPYILYTGSTAIDLRKVSSYVIDPNVANQVLIRMQDENRTTVAMNQATFEAAYQAALNSVSSFGNGFSAHADEAELLTWQKQTGAKRTFLVHGEEDIMRQFAAHLGDTHVEMPLPNQSFNL